MPAPRAPSATARAPGESRSSPVSDSSPKTANAVERLGGHLTARGEHPKRQRRIESGADLAQERRREVRRDPAIWEREAGVEDRGAYAVA